MLKTITQFFVPPVFPDDEDKTNAARVLYMLLATMLAIMTFDIIIVLLLAPQKTGSLIGLSIYISFILTSYTLAQRGRVRLASALFVFGIWIVSTLVVLLIGRLTTSFISLHVAIAVIAGTLLGRRSATALAVLSSVLGLGLAILENAGVPLPKYFPAVPLTSWFVWVYAFILALVALNLTLQGFTQALARARQSEARYASLFNYAADGIFITDLEGNYMDVNETGCRLLGYTREEILRMNIRDLLKPESNPAPIQFDELRAGRAVINERLLHHHDGFEVPVEISAKKIDNDRLQAIVRDITERKKAEEALQRSERTLNLFADFVPAPVAMFDRNMQYIAASRRYLADFRLGDQDLVGRSHYEVFPEIPERWKEIHRRCLAGAIEKADEDPFPRADGTLDWVRWEIHPWHEKSGEIGGIIWFSEVITERKKAEQKLMESEERYRRLFDGAREGIVVTGPDGTFMDANPAGVNMLGYKNLANMLGQPASQVYANPEHRREIFSRLLPNDYLESIEVELVKQDGSGEHIIVQANAVVQRDEHGQLLQTEVMFNDITDRKQAALELEQNRQWLENIFNALEEAVFVVTPQRELININQAAERIFGYSLAELKDKSTDILHVDHDHYVEFGRRIQAAFDQGQAANFEFQVRRKNGEVFPSEHTVALLKTETGQPLGIISVVRDITERKRAEDTLRASEEQFKQLAENIEDVFWIRTAGTGNMLYINPAYEKIWGRSIQSLYENRQSFMDAVHPDDIEKVREEYKRAIKIGEFAMEYRIVRPDGSIRWINARSFPIHDENGNLIRTVGVATDITKRKQAEEALRASETKYRTLFENMQEGFGLSEIILDDQGKAVDFRFLDANAAYERHTGMNPDDIRGKTMLEVLPDADTRRIETFGKVALTGKSQVLEFYSEAFQRHFRVRTFSPKHGQFATIFEDISDRKQAEEALRYERALLRRVIDTSPAVIFVKDYESTIVVANQAMAGFYNLTVEEVTGRRQSDLHREFGARQEDVEQWLADDQAVIDSDESKHILEGGVDSSNQPHWFDTVKVPIDIGTGRKGVLVFSEDITARKLAEQKLDQQHQRLKVLREIDSGILAADSVENIVGAALSHIRQLIDCKRASVTLIEWEKQESVFYNVQTEGETVVPKGTRVSLADSQWILEIVSKNQPLVINELTILPEPIPEFQMMIQAGYHSMCMLPLFVQNSLIGTLNMSSEIPGFFDEEKINLGHEVANQVAIAITQNNLLAALQELNAELEQRVIQRTAQLQIANKELEAFSYSVSHDLRTPLRGINGFSKALARKYSDALGEDGQHYLTRIQENTSRMDRMIDDLLQLARVTRHEMKQDQMNLSMIAHEIAEALHAQEPGRDIEVEIENQVEARGDAGMLRLVLQNLLGNAFKFTSTRERAIIEFGISPHPPVPLPGTEERKDDGQVFFVRDNGVGFDMAYANKLFNVFERLHAVDEFPGTGIGLVTVQRIIQRHGGRVWVEAEVDKGATFYFTLGAIE